MFVEFVNPSVSDSLIALGQPSTQLTDLIRFSTSSRVSFLGFWVFCGFFWLRQVLVLA